MLPEPVVSSSETENGDLFRSGESVVLVMPAVVWMFFIPTLPNSAFGDCFYLR